MSPNAALLPNTPIRPRRARKSEAVPRVRGRLPRGNTSATTCRRMSRRASTGTRGISGLLAVYCPRRPVPTDGRRPVGAEPARGVHPTDREDTTKHLRGHVLRPCGEEATGDADAVLELTRREFGQDERSQDTVSERMGYRSADVPGRGAPETGRAPSREAPSLRTAGRRYGRRFGEGYCPISTVHHRLIPRRFGLPS